MKISELFKRVTKSSEYQQELGDGKAEFLGAGTYEDYEKEDETELSWREYIKQTLKIDL